jgi:hypothetical protein
VWGTGIRIRASSAKAKYPIACLDTFKGVRLFAGGASLVPAMKKTIKAHIIRPGQTRSARRNKETIATMLIA